MHDQDDKAATPAPLPMNDQVIVICSFDTMSGRLSANNAQEIDLEETPATVTLGFRQVFRKAFSSAHTILSPPGRIEWLGYDFIPITVLVLSSAGTEMKETEDAIFFFVFHLQHAYNDPNIDQTLHNRRISADLNEQGAIFALMSSFLKKQSKSFPRFSHSRDLPGLRIMTLPQPAPNHEVNILDGVLMVVFYSYAKQLLWRIRRSQVEIRISPKQSSFDESLDQAITQRIRLVRIQQYFLTSNISNSAFTRLVRVYCLKKLFLERDFERHDLLNQKIEQHLELLERKASERQRRQEERAQKSLDLSLKFLTFFLVSFSAISTTMSVKPTAPMVSDPFIVISNPSLAIVIGFGIALPLAVYMTLGFIPRALNAIVKSLLYISKLMRPNRTINKI